MADVLAGMKMVAEGVRTTEAALALAARHGVELPIAAQVGELLAGRKDPRTALYELMLRPQRAEAGYWISSGHWDTGFSLSWELEFGIDWDSSIAFVKA